MTQIALFFVVFQDLYCCLGQNSTLVQLSINVLCKQSPRNIEKTDDKKKQKKKTFDWTFDSLFVSHEL